MLREGTWRLYRLYKGGSQRRLVGRFAFRGSEAVILEDHDGVVEGILDSKSRFTGDALRRLEHLQHSPYWWLVCEGDIEEGHYPELLPSTDESIPPRGEE